MRTSGCGCRRFANGLRPPSRPFRFREAVDHAHQNSGPAASSAPRERVRGLFGRIRLERLPGHLAGFEIGQRLRKIRHGRGIRNVAEQARKLVPDSRRMQRCSHGPFGRRPSGKRYCETSRPAGTAFARLGLGDEFLAEHRRERTGLGGPQHFFLERLVGVERDGLIGVGQLLESIA